MSSNLGGTASQEKNKKMSLRPSDCWRKWDPGSHFHIVQGFRGQSTVLCGSCGFNIRDAHTEFFMHSTLAA